MKNFDELFDQNELSGVPMLHKDEKVVFWEEPAPGSPPESVWTNLQKISEPKIGWTGLNSGVIVLKPDVNIFKELKLAASKMLERPCCPSQELIYRYFEVRRKYYRLPPIYNMRKLHMLSYEEQAHYKVTTKIYHFVEKRKPIVMGLQHSKGDYFASRWWSHALELDRQIQDIDENVLRVIRAESIRSALA